MQRQSIHVRSQSDGALAAIRAPWNHGHDAGLTDMCFKWDFEPMQFVGDGRSRPVLFKAELWMPMQIVPYRL